MKKFTQVKKVINGTEYIAQFNGFGAMYQMADEVRIGDTEARSAYKTAEYLFKNVLVEPKVGFDDFEDADELNAVIKFLGDVNSGTFRENTDKEASKGNSKK